MAQVTAWHERHVPRAWHERSFLGPTRARHEHEKHALLCLPFAPPVATANSRTFACESLNCLACPLRRLALCAARPSPPGPPLLTTRAGACRQAAQLVGFWRRDRREASPLANPPLPPPAEPRFRDYTGALKVPRPDSWRSPADSDKIALMIYLPRNRLRGAIPSAGTHPPARGLRGPARRRRCGGRLSASWSGRRQCGPRSGPSPRPWRAPAGHDPGFADGEGKKEFLI